MQGEQSVVQIEHPERVAWYQRLLHEWTGQEPHVMVAKNGQVAAWVTPYASKAGCWHPAPTQVWDVTIEQALAQLANYVYEDVQADVAWLATAESCQLGPKVVAVLSLHP